MPPLAWQAFQKMHITISADPVDCKQRIRFNRAPFTVNELAMKDTLKSNGYGWNGDSETGKWLGDKETVDMWNDVSWRRRVRLCCSNISFFGPDGTDVDMITYIEQVKAFDESTLEDDLSSLGKSTVDPNPTPTKQKDSGPSSKRARS